MNTGNERDEKRLSRLFTHEFLRLGYHFGKLVLCVAHAAQCNVIVFVHNFVSVVRAALRVPHPASATSATSCWRRCRAETQPAGVQHESCPLDAMLSSNTAPSLPRRVR